jgi:predicted ester cyclase
MSAADNNALVLRYFLESYNPPYHLTVITETCTLDYATQQTAWHTMERAAFPDKHFTIEDAIAEGDRVVVRWHFRGTHVGPFWTPVGTIAGTGTLLQVGATLTYRVDQGRIAEEWASVDWLAVIQQLGGICTVPGAA